ncbi:hypothetical protein PSYJA_44501, partial [Pseudomonas syringae pv. japonica str. M301072]
TSRPCTTRHTIPVTALPFLATEGLTMFKRIAYTAGFTGMY